MHTHTHRRTRAFTHAHTRMKYTVFTIVLRIGTSMVQYGVATISRLLEIIGLFCKRALYKKLFSAKETYNVKGGTEPLENEFHEILGSKRGDRFSVCFLYLLRLSNSCKGPRTLRKIPQKCHKIAGCYECAVYGSRPSIASKPGSSRPERPGLDNITSQPWSDATCPCITY